MPWIKDGVYHPGKANIAALQSRQSSTWKKWSHKEQRHDHASEIIQPYTRDGKPSESFIEVYPEESVDYGFVKSEAEIIGTDSNTTPIDQGAQETMADDERLIMEIPREVWDQ